MSQEWSVPGWAVLATLVALVLVVALLAAALLRSRARTVLAVESARREAAALGARVEALERNPVGAVRQDETEYVVTMLGREAEESDEPAPVLPAPLFADLVLREGVVQAVSLAAGLRRALAPEMRHRIRFEMKREVKRARKQRRADLRQAKRELDARQRGEAEAA